MHTYKTDVSFDIQIFLGPWGLELEDSSVLTLGIHIILEPNFLIVHVCDICPFAPQQLHVI